MKSENSGGIPGEDKSEKGILNVIYPYLWLNFEPHVYRPDFEKLS